MYGDIRYHNDENQQIERQPNDTMSNFMWKLLS